MGNNKNQVEIYVFQADEGDSFLITINYDAGTINLLIDCGTELTYRQYIRNKLIEMAKNGQVIDYLILTHLHSDHIGGAIPLLKENVNSHEAKIIPIHNVLYNGFLGLELEHYPKEACEVRDSMIYQGIYGQGAAIISECKNIKEITLQEELCISKLLLDGGYNWNGVSGKMPEMILTNELGKIDIGKNINLQLISPGFKQLHDMNKEWESFLKRIYRKVAFRDNKLARNAYEAFQYILNSEDYDEIAQLIGEAVPDKKGIEKLADKPSNCDYSKENGSSIAFLLQVDEKQLLFLGDACINVCQKKFNEIYGSKRMRLDLIKLSHHGSERNISEKFLQQFETTKYLISTGTGAKRPSKKTLALLLIHYPDKMKQIFLTNRNEHAIWMDQEKIHQIYDYEFIDIANQSIRL